MTNDELTLYVGADFVSVFAMSAFVALTEKRLPFAVEKIDLKAGQQRSPTYGAVSYTQRVPTLAHGDFSLSESSAIAEYLDEAFPHRQHARLFPRDPLQRAQARELQAWLRSDLQPLRSERPADLFYYPGEAKPLSEQAAAAARKLCNAAERLLRPGSLDLFDGWCIADCDFAVMLNRLVHNGDRVPTVVAKYVEHQWNRASLQSWVCRKRPAV